MEKLFRLIGVIAVAKNFDIIFLQRTTFPFKLGRILKMVNENIIFDIDDAIYLPDKQEEGAVAHIKKYIKESEVIDMLRVSKAVIVENEYIKDFVSAYCKNIFKIPGPIDTDRFFAAEKRVPGEIVIGWIGSPATTTYLHMLDNVFINTKKKYDFVRFRFIGLGRYENPGIKIERVEWNYETEVRELQGFDIGIMPMPDNEWTRGKLGCKMLQYMAIGIPAVVSYTLTNAEIIKNEENGFFANEKEEWIAVLSRLIEDKGLRIRIGEKARQTIIEKCSLSGNVGSLVQIFQKWKS